jgi:predicted nucleic acid-binding protein
MQLFRFSPKIIKKILIQNLHFKTVPAIDTNIISKLFDGHLPNEAIKFLSLLMIRQQYISVINRIELFSWKDLKGEKQKNVKAFIGEINEIALSEAIVASNYQN